MYSTIETFYFPSPWPEEDIIFNPAEHYQRIIESQSSNNKIERIEPSVRIFEGSIDSLVKILATQCNDPSKADGFHISIKSIENCKDCFELTGQFWKNYWGSRHCDHWISGAISTEWLKSSDTTHFFIENRILKFKRDGRSKVTFAFPNGQIDNYTIISVTQQKAKKARLNKNE